MGKKVLVAMSGGIDSSVAALLLKSRGYNVAGVTMRFGVLTEGDQKRSCTATAVEDAQKVCRHLDIPHYVLDYAAELENNVISYFISEYGRGRTPNPCVRCNRELKFGSLLDKALAMGFDFLATGHYAEIEARPSGYLLKKPRDKKKDQTYFLYAIPYEKLGHILFPLAPYTKDEIMQMAKQSLLPVAHNQESQDICFVPRKNYQEFLLSRGCMMRPGPIVDMNGKVLGQHRGIIFHTIGQRGGLGISHPTPLYVVSIDAVKNRIVVGEKKDVMGRGLVAGGINWLAKDWPKQVHAKIRYRKKEALCEVTKEKDKLKVIFAEEQEAITPGQSVVFYDDDRVLGGGIIETVLPPDQYDETKDSNRMMKVRGKVLAVNISQKKGEKKSNIHCGLFVENLGLENDAHAQADVVRQVSLLAKESIEKIRAKGLDVQYGDFAENLTTEGIDLPSLPIGTRLKIGDKVLLEVSQIGKVCHNRCNIFYTVGDCVMPREGIFAKVITGGEIKVHDEIEILDEQRRNV